MRNSLLACRAAGTTPPATDAPPPSADTPPLPRRWIGLAGIGTGIFMFTLDGSIVNVALPTLVIELHAGFATVQWIVLAYLLVVSSLVLGAARMGDLYGKKRIYLCGLGLFTAASLGCALSPDVRWLIGMRAVQGLGGVFVAALGAAIIAEIFPPKERGRALGFIGTSVLLGVALGPTSGRPDPALCKLALDVPGQHPDRHRGDRRAGASTPAHRRLPRPCRVRLVRHRPACRRTGEPRARPDLRPAAGIRYEPGARALRPGVRRDQLVPGVATADRPRRSSICACSPTPVSPAVWPPACWRSW